MSFCWKQTITAIKHFCVTDEIQIKQTGEGISVYAASYGLHEVYFDKMSWRVKAILIIDYLFFCIGYDFKSQWKQKRLRELTILVNLTDNIWSFDVNVVCDRTL